MDIQYLEELIDEGHEIEFIYNNKKYSISYGEINDIEVISFCEFYKESIEVTTVGDLLNIKVGNMIFSEVWKKLSKNDIWIV